MVGPRAKPYLASPVLTVVHGACMVPKMGHFGTSAELTVSTFYEGTEVSLRHCTGVGNRSQINMDDNIVL